jgi:hypothetical protein
VVVGAFTKVLNDWLRRANILADSWATVTAAQTSFRRVGVRMGSKIDQSFLIALPSSRIS